MNRDIKFRAWDTNKKEMFFCNCVKINGGLCDIIDERLLNENVVVMQFIGLKDKNGKEIYEGDIVICDRYETHDEFIVTIKDIRRLSDLLFGSELNSLEVIGNIYENPELIKELQK